jgi:hypothetical protein
LVSQPRHRLIGNFLIGAIVEFTQRRLYKTARRSNTGRDCLHSVRRLC